MASNYGNRIKKKASEMETVIKPDVEVDNNNMFVASMMQNHKEETQKEIHKEQRYDYRGIKQYSPSLKRSYI